MRCIACGTENRAGRRFCASCGAALTVPCPACGASNEPDERFCGRCGVALGEVSTGVPGEAAPPVARDVPATVASGRERKVATILFADLVGFTGLNEENDPELVQSLVTRAFDRLSAEVERYEGLIEKFAGDAMLAVFGVPQTHEDDAERAVRAALEMQSAMVALADELRSASRPELGLRIGIETGEVLVDHARATGERDRLVTGDPVNTAARLEASAAPGAIIVGPGTYAATRDLVDHEEVPPLALKGKAQPVPAWRVIAVKARRGGLRAPLGIQAPLVGREAELTLLKETLRRVLAERRPHLVTVVGAAGVGKSRITWEIEKYVDGLPESYVWRKGRCLAYGQPSFGALAEIVRVDSGILEDDEPAVARRKLDDRAATLGLSGGSEEGLLYGLLGLGELPSVGRDALFDVWRRYLEALARVAPAIIVVEDIHWADEGTLDLLEAVARWGSGAMLVLCLARHELMERRPTWGGGIPNSTSIVLEPLEEGQNGALIEALLPGGLPLDLRTRIVAVADGNPLFTEELVRMFVDRGIVRFVDGRWQLARDVDELEIPGSVHAVLAARLDSLPAQEKGLAQDAAVVGRIFWDAVLRYLAGDAPSGVDGLLRRLRVKELVVPREPSSLSGAGEYGFRHVLVRDVAYDSLPKRERAAKHLTVARWAERDLSDRTDEIAELLASHYLSALRYAEEFSDDATGLSALRRTTLEHARRAGERAARLYELQTATKWCRVALDLAPKLDLSARERATIALEFLEHGHGYWSLEEGEPVAQSAIAAIAEIVDPMPADLDLEAAVRTRYAYIVQVLDRTDEARRAITDMLDRLEGGQPTAARAMLLARLGWSLWRWGPIADAAPVLERALADARAAGAAEAERWALHELGIARSKDAGTYAEGTALVRQSMELARAAGDTTLLIRCHINLAATLMGSGGDLAEPMDLIDSGLDLARRAMDRHAEGWLLHQRSQLMDLLGRIEDARDAADRAAALALEGGDIPAYRGRKFMVLWTHALEGRWDLADALVSEIPGVRDASDEQNRVWIAIWDAWQSWRTDPDSGVERLHRELPGITLDEDPGALWLARMAFRVGRADALETAANVMPLTAHAEEGEARRGVRRWIHLLGQPPTTSGPALLEIARRLEALGYIGFAEQAFCDAALALARSGGDPTEALRAAQRIQAVTGIVPVLGPLPETRWIAAHAVGTGASS